MLGKDGGALKKMLPAFKVGLGGRLGNGSQWMSWVHIDDVVNAIMFLVKNESLKGAFNVTSPKPVTNADFTKILAKTLKRPALLNMPDFVIKILFGEVGEALLLNGQKVIPNNLMNSGYDFVYKDMAVALEDICG